jgi:hypothetical protein
MTSKKLNFKSFAGKAIKSSSATSAVALTILLTTASVWAQSTAPAMEGTPSAAPMSAKELMSAFTKADANKDGKFISKAEFEKAIQ